MTVAQPNLVFGGPPSGTVQLSFKLVEPRIRETILSVNAVLLQNQQLKCKHVEGRLIQMQRRKFFHALGSLAAQTGARLAAGSEASGIRLTAP